MTLNNVTRELLGHYTTHKKFTRFIEKLASDVTNGVKLAQLMKEKNRTNTAIFNIVPVGMHMCFIELLL